MSQIREVMRRPILIDGRNMYDATSMQNNGFVYRGIGHSSDSVPELLSSADNPNLFHQQATLGIEEQKLI